MNIENNTIGWSSPYIGKRMKEREANGERRALQAMLQKLLNRKFGFLSSELISKIESAEMESLEKLVDGILDVESIDDVENFLNYSV